MTFETLGTISATRSFVPRQRVSDRWRSQAESVNTETALRDSALNLYFRGCSPGSTIISKTKPKASTLGTGQETCCIDMRLPHREVLFLALIRFKVLIRSVHAEQTYRYQN